MEQLQLSVPLSGRVLLTGASGFIGGRLRQALLHAGADVVSLVRPSSPPAKCGRVAPVSYREVGELRTLIERERPDYVIHVAGATKGVSYREFCDANVMPTQNLLQAVIEAHPDVKRFVFISSGSAYGPSNDGPPKREHDPQEPVEHYGRSKLEAERVVMRAGDKLAWTILRPATVYGPGEADLFTLFKAAHNRVNLFYGNRQKRASCVYVDDLLEAIARAAQHDATRGRGYFVCDGEPYTWEQIQSEIARAVGKRTVDLDLPGFLVPLAGQAGEWLTAIDRKPRLFNRQKALLDAQRAWLFSNEAAKADFAFECRVPLREGMARTARWYREQGWL